MTQVDKESGKRVEFYNKKKETKKGTFVMSVVMDRLKNVMENIDC